MTEPEETWIDKMSEYCEVVSCTSSDRSSAKGTVTIHYIEFDRPKLEVFAWWENGRVYSEAMKLAVDFMNHIGD